MINYLKVKNFLSKFFSGNKEEKIVLVHDRKKGDYYRKQLVNTEMSKPSESFSHSNNEDNNIIVNNTPFDADEELTESQKKFVKQLETEYSPWIKNLSLNENLNISRYTDNDYFLINKFLRSVSTSSFTHAQIGELTRKIKAITSALNKSEVKTPLIVHRQVKGLDLLGKLKSCMESGGTWEDPAFMSTTVIKDSFNTVSPEGVIHLVIDVPKGKGIGGFVKGLSKYPIEQEFLLNKGSRFEVKNIENPKTNQYVVHLKLVGRNTEDDVNYDL